MSIEELDKGLDRLFSQPKKYEIYQFIAGIICLSKITFAKELNDSRCVISSEHSLKLAAQLFSFDEVDLTDALTNRSINVATNGVSGENIRQV